MSTHETDDSFPPQDMQLGKEVGPTLREQCGIGGVYAYDTSLPVAAMLRAGMDTMRHRGHIGAGMTIKTSAGLIDYKSLGTVQEAFRHVHALDSVSPEAILAHAHLQLGAGEGVPPLDSLQPWTKQDTSISHNGNITNITALAREYDIDRSSHVSDSQTLPFLLEKSVEQNGGNFEKGFKHLLKQLKGGYAIIVIHKEKLYGTTEGRRPLALGKIENNGGWALASETQALDIMRATEEQRHLKPGEIVKIDQDGITSSFIESNNRLCLLEHAFRRSDGNNEKGVSIADTREELGKQLAENYPLLDADIVVAVKSAAITAQKYAESLGISEITFTPEIDPIPLQRGIEAEIVAVSPSVKSVQGKKVVLMETLIGNGQKNLQRFISQLWKDGATEIHLLSPYQPIRNPCEYGMLLEQMDELAGGMTDRDIQYALGVTSVGFLSDKKFEEAVDMSDHCKDCQLHPLLPFTTQG